MVCDLSADPPNQTDGCHSLRAGMDATAPSDEPVREPRHIWWREHPRAGLLPTVPKVSNSCCNTVLTQSNTNVHWQECNRVLRRALCKGLFHNVCRRSEEHAYFRTMEGEAYV